MIQRHSMFSRLPIRLKLVMIIFAISMGALLLSMGLETAFSWRINHANISRRLEITADIISLQSRAALEFVDQAAGRENLRSLAADPAIRQACLYDEWGIVFATYNTHADTACPRARRPGIVSSWKELQLFKDINSHHHKLGSVYLAYDLSGMVNSFIRETGARFLIIVILLGLVWLISAHLQRIISLPIVQLAEVTRRFGRQREADMEHIERSEDELGELVEAFGVMMEEIRVNELQLRSEKDRAEDANRAKSEFLANMSHEIRTPMNAVIGLANILTMTQPLSPKQKEYLTTLLGSADSLLGLLNDLLDVSKLEEGSLVFEQVPFDLAELAGRVISMNEYRAREKQIEIQLDTEELPHRRFIGDPLRIQQVLTNLVSNAVKFTHRGFVRISLIAQLLGHEKMEVQIRVTDTGIGIPEEKTAMIFEKFTQADASTTRQYGGTGLGLAICKSLTEQMGGTVGLTSHSGQGSTFTVTLPLATAPEDEAKAGESKRDSFYAAPADVRMGALPILLVEDHAPNILVASAMLNQFGYDCEVAANGVEALARYREREYALILMDIQMPRMDGIDATRRIRELEKEQNRKPVPIIAMTAFAFSTDKQACLDAGMNDYLSKPFEPETLRKKIVQWLKD